MNIILFTLLFSVLTVFTKISICLLIQLFTSHLWDISYESVGKGPDKMSYSRKNKKKTESRVAHHIPIIG